MTNRKKRAYLIDRDSVISDYCCSFVQERAAEVNANIIAKEKYAKEQNSLTGLELKEFYDGIVHDSNSRIKIQNKPLTKLRGETNTGSKKIKIEKCWQTGDSKKSTKYYSASRLTNRLLRISSEGNFKELNDFTDSVKHRKDYFEILNGADQYGWTPVMCAAAGGHIKTVQHLINEGCLYKKIVENTGKNIFDICKQKRRHNILEFLMKCKNGKMHEDNDTQNQAVAIDDIIKCELCGTDYPKSKHKSHEASMMHIFQDNTKAAGMAYEIPDHNVGFQMMLRSGWELSQGLGPEGSGCKNPVKTILKQDRYGLGVKSQNKKRVTHFSAFDHHAVKQKVVEKRVKKSDKRTYEEKIIKDKAWERNMRHYMSSDY